MSAPVGSPQASWSEVGGLLRASGMRWTPQRRLLIRVLEESEGHVTAGELIERCRAMDPETTPSTVYRTLDVLEELGVLRHAHAADGREEYHIMPTTDHGHLHCRSCGKSWEIEAAEAATLVKRLRERRGFEVDLSHLSVAGQCADCLAAGGIALS